MGRYIKEDLFVLLIGVIGLAITLLMMKFIYNINQVFKIITFVVAMLSSLCVLGSIFHIFKNITRGDYWRK
jgi:hypothetical protein